MGNHITDSPTELHTTNSSNQSFFRQKLRFDYKKWITITELQYPFVWMHDSGKYNRDKIWWVCREEREYELLCNGESNRRRWNFEV